MSDLLAEAEAKRRRAWALIDELGLLERWSPYGNPILVGAVRTGLMGSLDIDIEVYSDAPSIQTGFSVMSEIASLPGFWKLRFTNALDTVDQGLYWQIRYRETGGDVWKVDTWLVAHDHPHAYWATQFAEAMDEALTEPLRRTILQIKNELADEPERRGIDVYRAVLEANVQSATEFRRWIQANPQPAIVAWRPTAQRKST